MKTRRDQRFTWIFMINMNVKKENQTKHFYNILYIHYLLCFFLLLLIHSITFRKNNQIFSKILTRNKLEMKWNKFKVQHTHTHESVVFHNWNAIHGHLRLSIYLFVNCKKLHLWFNSCRKITDLILFYGMVCHLLELDEKKWKKLNQETFRNRKKYVLPFSSAHIWRQINVEPRVKPVN